MLRRSLSRLLSTIVEETGGRARVNADGHPNERRHQLSALRVDVNCVIGHSGAARDRGPIRQRPPGGSTDVAARIVADHMSRTLGQQIIVQNVPGAGGTTGSIRAMRAEPDGYTILMGQMGTHAASVALYPNLAYKPDTDFEPIGMVTAFPLIIAARKDFPPKDLKEFDAYLKANASTIN